MCKKYLFIIFFFMLTLNLQALSWRQENVYIRNHLSNDIIILAEFIENIDDYSWTQKIAGSDVRVFDYFFLYKHENVYNIPVEKSQSVIVVEPTENYTGMYQTLDIIGYSPYTEIKNFLAELEKLYEIPLKSKLEDIFKEFIIKDSNGNILYTLEDIDKIPLTYKEETDDIILEIYP